MTSDILLETKGLQVRFGGVIAADNVDAQIMQGKNLAIIGPNGAGKTTFLNICTGYIKPSSGSVYVLGIDATRKTPRQITRMGIARAFQIPQLFNEHTAIENLLIAAAAREKKWSPFTNLEDISERDEMMSLLALFDCHQVAERLVSELPEGKRKLVDIAVALALKPKLLFMDEPTSGVASSEKFQIMDILNNALSEAKVTSVFVEHDMAVVEKYADEVAVWSQGAIQLRGTPEEILSHPTVLKDVIGESV